MASDNPVFNNKILNRFSSLTAETTQVMTVHGTINKTGLLIVLTVLGAAVGWNYQQEPFFMPALFVFLLINLGIAFYLPRNPAMAPRLAPAYALMEGFVLGGISATFNAQIPGVVFHAMTLTFATVALMLALYGFRVITVTEKMKSIIMASVMAIGIAYLVDIVMHFFGSSIPMIHQSSTGGIIFSVVVCGVAAATLLLDFDMVEKSADRGMPKYMEWYGGFAVLVTIVWLYMEMLRLMSKLNKR